MTYMQLVTPDVHVPCKPGWCLNYVNDAYGVPAVYGTATEAWDASTTKHLDKLFPSGCAVPVWFELHNEPAGHVALMMPDGSVYSTSGLGETAWHHPNLSDLIQFYAYYGMPLTYLGWSEDVEGTRVVSEASIGYTGTVIDTPPITEQDEDMKILATDGKSPQVWVGDYIFRRPVWTLDTMHGMQWSSEKGILGPLYKDGEVQTYPDLNVIGIDIMALLGKDVNGH